MKICNSVTAPERELESECESFFEAEYRESLLNILKWNFVDFHLTFNTILLTVISENISS